MFDYVKYAQELRHELHQCPEIGFDLPKTNAIVKRELDAMGVRYTEEFGKGSIVATINEGKPFTIGLRGDMDALPVQEASSNPYPSQHPGCMHACGHDVHTAQMIAVCRQLNDMKDSIRCRMKILFTPAEEYITPGCKMMVENGVMDDIDCVVTAHVDPNQDVGNIALLAGGINANSMGIVIEFFGKTAHANSQHKGVDAIRMAVEAYMAMELIVAREAPSVEPCLLNVGAFNAGHTNNIVCDYAKLFVSSRTHSDELTAFMERRIREVCEGVAQMAGGSCKVTVTKLLPYVDNHPVMVEKMRQTAQKVLGAEHVLDTKRTMGGEDFAFLSRKKPGVLYRLGTRNANNPDTASALHNDHFDVDESCFAVSIPLFVNFVLDNQDGIVF
ncbi:MAG: amidohydrolase [Ruminococcaceae bacterium]|nr:amidohydrolase [Oscillospiraceae bacterium]